MVICITEASTMQMHIARAINGFQVSRKTCNDSDITRKFKFSFLWKVLWVEDPWTNRHKQQQVGGPDSPVYSPTISACCPDLKVILAHRPSRKHLRCFLMLKEHNYCNVGRSHHSIEMAVMVMHLDVVEINEHLQIITWKYYFTRTETNAIIDGLCKKHFNK